MFLFRDADGRLPSARELRLRGFRISEAVALDEPEEPQTPAETSGPGSDAPARALAAEPPAVYGGAGPEPKASGG